MTTCAALASLIAQWLPESVGRLGLRCGGFAASGASAQNARVNATTANAGPLRRFVTVSLARELGILLSLTLMFPFMIHILPVPEDARLGPRLLPMFYAPLLAALIGRTQSALLVALAAPWLNWALTGHPGPRDAIVMTLQLVVFVVALRALQPRVNLRWLHAAPAYFAAIAASVMLTALLPGLIGGRPALASAAHAVTMGLPGILILVLINWLVVRSYPSGPGGNGPVTA